MQNINPVQSSGLSLVPFQSVSRIQSNNKAKSKSTRASKSKAPQLVLGNGQLNQYELLPADDPLLEYLKPRPRDGHDFILKSNNQRGICKVCRAKKVQAGLTNTCGGSSNVRTYCPGCPDEPFMCGKCYKEIHILP